jgi:ketosteroid isomerase-like protein
MYAWLVRKMIRRSIDRMNGGDIKPLVTSFAHDARLVFPGRSSWAGDYRGRDQIEAFLDRFVRVGLQAAADEIVVKGPPWNTTICVRFRDEAHAPDGTVVYSNRAVLFMKTAWGKIVSQEDYIDTEKVSAFDEYLAADGAPGVAKLG